MKDGIVARTVADQFAELLAAAGVKRTYGIVGDSLNGLRDSLRYQGQIEWIHVRHEEVAAAGAETHLTREFGVCAGSCGPGNLHLIHELFDCHRSRVLVLAIAAHVPSCKRFLDQLAALLNGESRVTMLCGSGCQGGA